MAARKTHDPLCLLAARAGGIEMCSHNWLFTWVLGIRTQEQALLPTEPSPQPTHPQPPPQEGLVLSEPKMTLNFQFSCLCLWNIGIAGVCHA